MRLADDARKCVIFIGDPEIDADGEETVDPKATAFLIKAAPGEHYLVTAAHVAEAITAKPGPYSFRLNTKDGRARCLEITDVDWIFHPDHDTSRDDSYIDIAIMRFEPPAWADILSFPCSHLITRGREESKDIGSGDMIYVVGLFNRRYGNKRNLPIVHTGNIAMMAEDELIPSRDPRTKAKRQVEGYLVEAAALSGSSGSPVFVRRSVEIDGAHDKHTDTPLRTWIYGTVFLLGVWQSAWEGEPEDVLAAGLDLKGQKVPVGLGIVTPAYQLEEIVNRPELRTARERARDDHHNHGAAVMDASLSADAIPAPSTKADNSSHKEDFNRLLTSVATGKKPDDQT